MNDHASRPFLCEHVMSSADRDVVVVRGRYLCKSCAVPPQDVLIPIPRDGFGIAQAIRLTPAQCAEIVEQAERFRARG